MAKCELCGLTSPHYHRDGLDGDEFVPIPELGVESEQYDRMFGEGEWIVHEGCPAALEAGQDRAVHHKEYHHG